MDILTDSHQVRRLEVVDTGRRRRWSREEKLRIVAESFSGPRQASSTARRHGISTTLLFAWRKALREGKLEGAATTAGFVPALVVAEHAPSPSAARPSLGRMVIVLANGRRLIVDAGVEAAALARVVDVLERR
jgi:transposase